MLVGQAGLPQYLYHGSGFEQKELKPGFQHTKKAVVWDKVESNLYLYTTAIREAAELLGFSSAIEKKFDLRHTNFNEKNKTIKLEFTTKPPSIEQILEIPVYLYKIRFRPDVWTKCNNLYNNIDDEWKTRLTIPTEDIEEREVLDLSKVLKDFVFSIS